MEVKCWGKGRKRYTHYLIPDDADISKVGPSGSHEYQLFRRISINEDGDALVVRSSTKGIAMNGHFWITVRLTKKEIANLARIAFAEVPFGEVANLLRKPRYPARQKSRSR
jgi:hypothetical protein